MHEGSLSSIDRSILSVFPWAIKRCRSSVNRVTLAVSRSLPIYTPLRTCRRAAITDALCQKRL
jgi:hypothetical protein